MLKLARAHIRGCCAIHVPVLDGLQVHVAVQLDGGDRLLVRREDPPGRRLSVGDLQLSIVGHDEVCERRLRVGKARDQWARDRGGNLRQGRVSFGVCDRHRVRSDGGNLLAEIDFHKSASSLTRGWEAVVQTTTF
mgnify:CR=1 FL=1